MSAVDLFPPGVEVAEDGRHYNAETWNPRHKLVVAMHCSGKKNTEIAELLGLHPGTVSQILNDPRAIYETEELAKRLTDLTIDTGVRLKLLSNEALDEVVEEMRTARDVKVRQKAAFGILDRAGYAPAKPENAAPGIELPESVINRMEATTKELVLHEATYRVVEPKKKEEPNAP